MSANGVETFANYAAAQLPDYGNVRALLDNVTSYYDWNELSNNGYFDDLLWWCLASIRGYEQWGDKTMLALAETIFADVQQKSWDTTVCGGGFWWSYMLDYKNAITNSLAIVAASKLHVLLENGNRSAPYGVIADKALSWFLASGMLDLKTGLVSDGLLVLSNG